jgi:hypothetical protein
MRTHGSTVLNDTLTSYVLGLYSHRCHVFSSLEKSSTVLLRVLDQTVAAAAVLKSVSFYVSVCLGTAVRGRAFNLKF